MRLMPALGFGELSSETGAAEVLAAAVAWLSCAVLAVSCIAPNPVPG